MATWFSPANEEDNHHISTSLNARASSILDWIPRAKSLVNRVTADPQKTCNVFQKEVFDVVYH